MRAGVTPIAVFCFSLFAAQVIAVSMPMPAIIPQPLKLEQCEGSFQLQRSTRIVVDESSRATGEYLAEKLRPATGLPLRVSAGSATRALRGAIMLTTNGVKPGLGAEGYTLDVAKDGVLIRAASPAGLFYGAQTLLQLLPPEVYSAKPVAGIEWAMPCVQIEDQPRFGWRGMMLDVGRHFITKEEIKRLLDELALHKINVFHWHLTDDQGWRIEIKKYPRLTQEGAWRPGVGFDLPRDSTTAYGPDGRYGGFYTQDDVREVVAYAQARHITVVPEIEMPGHSSAVLSVYPELSCAGGPFRVAMNGGVTHGVYCAGRDESFTFLQDVLTEVFALFPGQYIHIGGDEAPKDNWKKCARCQARMKAEGLKNEHELQSWFIRRMEKFIIARDKKLIGWSEIQEGGLAPSATVMDWIGGGLEAARAGNDVIMTPTEFCYLDYYQSLDQAAEPKAICCYLPLEKVYSFEPVPAGLPSDKQAHILGAQGNVWTEVIPNFKQVEYMLFPRLCAMAEVVWSPKAARDWNSFTNRLALHEQRLDQLGINRRRTTSVKLGQWTPTQIRPEPAPVVWDVTPQIKNAGQYRITWNYDSGSHGISIDSVVLLEDGREVARDAHDGFAGASPRQPVYVIELAALKAGARYSLRALVKGEGGTDSQGWVSCVFTPVE